jgi:hypothetical protein
MNEAYHRLCCSPRLGCCLAPGEVVPARREEGLRRGR